MGRRGPSRRRLQRRLGSHLQGGASQPGAGDCRGTWLCTGRRDRHYRRGADTLKLGSGLGYAEGNDGNDKITGGTGNAVMYGNNGRDELDAGSGPATKQSYLDGGNGKNSSSTLS